MYPYVIKYHFDRESEYESEDIFGCCSNKTEIDNLIYKHLENEIDNIEDSYFDNKNLVEIPIFNILCAYVNNNMYNDDIFFTIYYFDLIKWITIKPNYDEINKFMYTYLDIDPNIYEEKHKNPKIIHHSKHLKVNFED